MGWRSVATGNSISLLIYLFPFPRFRPWWKWVLRKRRLRTPCDYTTTTRAPPVIGCWAIDLIVLQQGLTPPLRPYKVSTSTRRCTKLLWPTPSFNKGSTIRDAFMLSWACWKIQPRRLIIWMIPRSVGWNPLWKNVWKCHVEELMLFQTVNERVRPYAQL